MIMTFDIGGTSIKYGLMILKDKHPEFLMQKEISSDARIVKGPGILQRVIDLTADAMQQQVIEGIAISTAGMVDAEKGCIQYANDNIPEYTGLQFKNVLEERFHIPCWVENDVNAAALGESAFGAGRGAAHVLMLTIGTGIGGAVVIDPCHLPWKQWKCWRNWLHVGEGTSFSGYCKHDGTCSARTITDERS